MADWPDADELKQVLNLSEADDWAITVDRILAAAIYRVKQDVGEWDELTDEPDDSLAQAALRMGELIAERPDAPVVGIRSRVIDDPTYWRLIFGHRKRFALA